MLYLRWTAPHRLLCRGKTEQVDVMIMQARQQCSASSVEYWFANRRHQPRRLPMFGDRRDLAIADANIDASTANLSVPDQHRLRTRASR